MKSQDVLFLFKLISIAAREKNNEHGAVLKSGSSVAWQDWKDIIPGESVGVDFVGTSEESPYSLRSLENETGISKSQVSLSMKRCEEVALLRPDRRTGLPKVNETGLTELVVYGLKYCFPAKPAEVTRGIATSFAAPALKGELFTSGDLPWVWPDAKGNTKGQAIEPLYKTVPYAVRRDERLYALLALTDSIRLGQSRERNLAIERFNQMLKSGARDV